MSRLSSKQTALLCALTRDHRPADGLTLANRLGSPVSGVHRTAASLARRGLIYTLRYSGLGVQYELAPAGRAALEVTGPAVLDQHQPHGEIRLDMTRRLGLRPI